MCFSRGSRRLPQGEVSEQGNSGGSTARHEAAENTGEFTGGTTGPISGERVGGMRAEPITIGVASVSLTPGFS